MAKLFIPKHYQSLLSVKETELAIKFVKDQFQMSLSSELKLRRVTAPLIVEKGTGINDDLNGFEKPVGFVVGDLGGMQIEIVHSLAKWKRLMLKELKIEMGYGIYTDMNALRPDEELSNIHSIYVDQWDWEKVISSEDRNLKFLKRIVKQIFYSLKRTEFLIYENYPQITPILPDEITFIHTEDLIKEYPTLTAKEREYEIAKKYKAVFLIGIGGELADGKKHDGRAPDYDDWSTQTSEGYKGLNGDILVWNPVLENSFELSSMGIRVDKKALEFQLKTEKEEHRKELMFHKKLLSGELTESIGGGIGQSRLCMFLLRKAHIGEVQSSIWSEKMRAECAEAGIFLF